MAKSKGRSKRSVAVEDTNVINTTNTSGEATPSPEVESMTASAISVKGRSIDVRASKAMEELKVPFSRYNDSIQTGLLYGTVIITTLSPVNGYSVKLEPLDNLQSAGGLNYTKGSSETTNLNKFTNGNLEALEENLTDVFSSCHIRNDYRNLVLHDVSSLQFKVVVRVSDLYKKDFSFKATVTYLDSSTRNVVVKVFKIYNDVEIFTAQELADAKVPTSINNKTIYNIEKNKPVQQDALKPTMLRYNYKINSSSLFNQSSSFIFSTLNRVPIVTLSPKTIDLYSIRSNNSKTAALLDYTGKSKNVTSTKPTTRYDESGLPEFKNERSPVSKAVTNYDMLNFKEIQENLGYGVLNINKSHVKYYANEDNRYSSPRNTSPDLTEENSDYLFRSEARRETTPAKLINDNFNLVKKILCISGNSVNERINQEAIKDYIINHGYNFTLINYQQFIQTGLLANFIRNVNVNVTSSTITLTITYKENGTMEQTTVFDLSSIPMSGNVLDNNYFIFFSLYGQNEKVHDFSGAYTMDYHDKVFMFIPGLINVRPKETRNIENDSKVMFRGSTSNTLDVRGVDLISDYGNEDKLFVRAENHSYVAVTVSVIPYKDDDVLKDVMKVKREIKSFPRLNKKFNSSVNKMFYGILDYDGDLRGSEDGHRGNWSTTQFTYRDYRQVFTGGYEPHFGIPIKETGAYGLETLLLSNNDNLNNIKSLTREYYETIDRDFNRSNAPFTPNKRSTRTLNKITGSFTSKTLLLADSNKFLVRENDSNIAMFSNWGRYFNNNSYLNIDSLEKIDTKFIGNDYIGLLDDEEDKSLEGKLKGTSLIGDFYPNTLAYEELEITDVYDGTLKPVTMNISMLYSNLTSYTTKYGYSGGWSSSSSLGRFVMSPDDFNRMLGTPSKECWWEGLRSYRNTIRIGGVNRLQFYHAASDVRNIHYKVNGGSDQSFQVGAPGFFAYIKVFIIDKQTGERNLYTEFMSVDNEASCDYTTSYDSTMSSQFPTFYNISVYSSERCYGPYGEFYFNNDTIEIEYHAQDNDSSINVTVTALNPNDVMIDGSGPEYKTVQVNMTTYLRDKVVSVGSDKYGFSSSWNLGYALGRFTMSGEDFSKFIGVNSKSGLWNSMTEKRENIKITNTRILEIYKPARNMGSISYKDSTGVVKTVKLIQYDGLVAYIKVVDRDLNVVIDDFVLYDSPSSTDYTVSDDRAIKSDYPSFVNVGKFADAVKLKNYSFSTSKNIDIIVSAVNVLTQLRGLGYCKETMANDQFIDSVYLTYGTNYNDAYGAWSNYDSQIAAKYGYANGRYNDGLSRFYCKFDEYKEIAIVESSGKKWGPKDYESYTITTTNLNNKQSVNISKVLIKTVGTYVEVYLNGSSSYHIRQNINGQSFLYVLKDKKGNVIDDIFIMFIQGSGVNTAASRDAEMQKKFPNFHTIVDPSGTNVILEKTYIEATYEITCACKHYTHYIRSYEVTEKQGTYEIGNRTIKNPKSFLPVLTNKALESLMVFSNNKIKTKTVDPSVFEKFYNNAGGIKPAFMNHVMRDLGPSIDTREYFFITDESGYNNRQNWSSDSGNIAKGVENQLVYSGHVMHSHHGFFNIPNLISLNKAANGDELSLLEDFTYGKVNGLMKYIEYSTRQFTYDGSDEVVGNINGQDITAKESFELMSFSVNMYGSNVAGKENTFKNESSKVKSSLTSESFLTTEEISKYSEEQTKLDGLEPNPYTGFGAMKLANGYASIYPFYGGMMHKIFTTTQKEVPNDYSGTFLTPIPLFNNPMVNGMNYRLAINYGLHGGNGLSVLCENQVFSTSNNATGLNVFNTYNDVYVGWGNGGSYVAQRANMSTTVGLQTNASYCKWSPYRKILENASKKYRDEKDKVNSTRYKDSLYLGKDPLDIANASNYIPVANIATETGYNKDNLLLPSERWRNIFVTYDCDIEFVGNTIFAHSPDGNGVDTESKHIMFTKPLRLKIVETYPTNSSVRTQLDSSKRYIEVKENGKEIPSLSKQVMISHDGSRLLTTADDIERDYAANQQGGGSTINFPKFVQAYTLSQFEIPLEMKTTSRPDNIVKNWLLQKTNISLSFDVNDMFIPSKLYLASDLGVFKSATLHSQQNDFFKRLHKYTIGSGSLDRPYSTVILDVMNRNNYKEICESNADFAQEAEEDFSFLSSLDDLEGIDNSEGMNVKPNYDKNRELMHDAYLTNGHDFMIANVTDDYTPPVKN